MVDMAGTKKRSVRRIQPDRQAPREVPSADELRAAIRAGTLEDKIQALREAGIIDRNGNLARKYRTWGNKPSRTPETID
jgi:hypothetical protein